MNGHVTNPSAADGHFPRLYPGLHLIPGGQIIYSRTGWRDTGGYNSAEPDEASFFEFQASNTGEWTPITDLMKWPERTEGMSVQLLTRMAPDTWTAQILVVGGGETNTTFQDTAEVLDTDPWPPTWQHPEMDSFESRLNPNVVLLPDGKAFIVGGMSGLDTLCRMYDPVTQSFDEMAPVHFTRAYHSVALLLPSGKVAVTGGGSSTIELYTPPYLSGGTGPVIANWPSTVHHEQIFQVTLQSSITIGSVVLVRPIAVTHQMDTEQRVIPLEFTQSGTTLDITAPDTPHPHPVAPRGHYMLFVLDSNGVPSKAKFVYLH